MASRISGNKLTNYLEGPYLGYINIDSSANIREISHDPSEFAQHVLGGIQQIITQTVLILAAITAIIFFNARLFLLLFAILLPPIFGIFYYIKAKRHAVRHLARDSSEKSLQHLQEALSGFVESNIYDKNELFLEKYMRNQQSFNKYISDQLIVQGIPGRTIEIFALLGIVILIVMNKSYGATENTAVITMGVFMAAAYKIIPGIVKILNISGQINTYAFTLSRLGGADQVAPERSDASGVEAIRSFQFRQVSFSYPGLRVLNNLNLCVGSGDFIGISGPSGKGKTTILNLLLGFLTPEKGEIVLNDRVCDPAVLRLFWLRVAYVKQQSFLIHDTILKNITLEGDSFNEQKLQQVIALSGLSELIGSCPEKWNKVISENGKNISGGQRQRIAIARALYKDADVILLDEPFNELDEASELKLLDHFRQLALAGKIILLITHNKKSLSFCSKIISLNEA